MQNPHTTHTDAPTGHLMEMPRPKKALTVLPCRICGTSQDWCSPDAIAVTCPDCVMRNGRIPRHEAPTQSLMTIA